MAYKFFKGRLEKYEERINKAILLTLTAVLIAYVGYNIAVYSSEVDDAIQNPGSVMQKL